MTNSEIDLQIQPLTSEAVLYQVISALFSRPGSDKFSILTEPNFHEEALTAAKMLDALKQRGTEIAPHLKSAFDCISNNTNTAAHEYSLIFGHTLSNELSPYGLEFLHNDDVFYRTQQLADLQGFYAAFGFEVNSIERADHISVESEFIGLLVTKEAYAHTNDLGEDAVEVCRSARSKFLEEHYLGWVIKLAVNLSKMQNNPFYAAVGNFTSAYMR